MRLPSTVFETVASTLPPLRRDSDYSGAHCAGSASRVWLRATDAQDIRFEGRRSYGDGSWSGRRDLNPRPSPWQGDALPLSHFRSCQHRALTGWCRGPDLNWGHQHFQCCALPTELPRPGHSHATERSGACQPAWAVTRALRPGRACASPGSRTFPCAGCPARCPPCCAGMRRGPRSLSDSPR